MVEQNFPCCVNVSYMPCKQGDVLPADGSSPDLFIVHQLLCSSKRDQIGPSSWGKMNQWKSIVLNVTFYWLACITSKRASSKSTEKPLFGSFTNMLNRIEFRTVGGLRKSNECFREWWDLWSCAILPDLPVLLENTWKTCNWHAVRKRFIIEVSAEGRIREVIYSIFRSNNSIGIDILTNDCLGVSGRRCFGAHDRTIVLMRPKTGFILRHVEDRPIVFWISWRSASSTSVAKVLLEKASCSSLSAFGWKGRRTSFRHWCRFKSR